MAQSVLHPKYEVKIGTYVLVLCALIGLTLLNVGLSFLPVGAFHPIFAVGIAVIEALTVILFFMHIWWSSKLVLVVMTLSDYTSRAWGLW
jgi:cytochrome c oxidase subunit 4